MPVNAGFPFAAAPTLRPPGRSFAALTD